jgi:hypothetical protein
VNESSEFVPEDCEYDEVYVVLSEEAGQPFKGVYVGVAAEYLVDVVDVGVGEAAVLDGSVLPHVV